MKFAVMLTNNDLTTLKGLNKLNNQHIISTAKHQLIKRRCNKVTGNG